MQTSATGIYNSTQHLGQTSRGFTLLEVMLVLFILGLATSLAVITLAPSAQSELDKQARQLLDEFSYARDLALNRHALVGWQLSKSGYRYVFRNQLGQWQPVTSRALPAGTWPANLHLEGADELADNFSADLAPALVFFPAGEVTNMHLTFKLDSAQRSIQIEAGAFTLLDLDHEQQ